MTTTSPAPVVSRSWREWHGYAPLDAPNGRRLAAAVGDLLEGVRRWRLWTYLAFHTVKNQYRRTTIGPWWITLQTLAYIIGLAVLFGAIFRRPLEEFLPYVGCGFVIFSFMVGLSTNAANAFAGAATSIVSNRQPLSVLIFKGAAIEVLQLAHNLLIIAGFAALGMLTFSPLMLLIVPSILLVTINGVALGMWLGPTVARFRDVGPLVASILQMLSFFTPIFWRVDSLNGQSRAALVAWNPFAYLLDTFRAPLLGMPVRGAFVGAAIITVINVVLGLLIFARTRSRVPYWVS